MTKEECYVKLKEQYDGYHFDYDTVGLYNPFSIFNTLSKLKFSDYWFETGTPSFLVYLLKHSNYRLDRITEEQVSGDLLNSIDSMSCNPIPVIYQSGYLTIKGYDKEFGIYRLGFPNKEVENGFIKYLLPFYTPVTEQESSFIITSFVMDIRQGNVGKFAEGISEEASTKEGKLSPTTKSIKGSFYERSIDNLYEVSVDESNLVAEDTDAATAIKDWFSKVQEAPDAAA